jgi:hypothetical protein
MNGFLLKLRHQEIGQKQPTFWRVFGSVRHELDRLYWFFPGQPSMGAPDGFNEDVPVLVEFESRSRFSTSQLWKPGTLSRYGDLIGDEYLLTCGIEPIADNPTQIAKRLDADVWRTEDKVIREFANLGHVVLIYTDSTCWEIYARKPTEN